MKILFYIAGGLLVISGLLHLVQVFTTPFDPVAVLPTLGTALFGIAYMVIGAFLFRGSDSWLRYGVLIPMVGGLLALINLGSNPTPYTILFVIIDVLVVALCAFLMRAGRPAISRIQR